MIPILSTHADDLEHGQFPGDQFEQDFPVSTIDSTLPSNIAADIDRNDISDASRRKTLLTFWHDGGQKQTNTDILRAFSVPPLSIPSDRTPSFVPGSPSRTPHSTIQYETGSKATDRFLDRPACITRKAIGSDRELGGHSPRLIPHRRGYQPSCPGGFPGAYRL